jgi:DNA-binding SARP family transcriptional activator
MLTVQLLGNFSASLDGANLTSLNSPRLQELFSYLILNRNHPISRYHLACLFWPESSDDQTQTNLRNLIHRLRKGFPKSDQFLQIDTYSLEWRTEGDYALDVDEFEHYLETGRSNGLQHEAFMQAVQIYRGDLLPDCYSDWIVPERERLRKAYLQALQTLSIIAEDNRDYPTALHYTRLLIQSDPLQAPANYQLIRLYSLLGDRPAAFKAYQTYAQLLKEELGEDPDTEIKDFIERIRVTASIATSQGTSSLAPLIGRKTEWQRIRSICEIATSGKAQILFVSGEAGIGKTRLVQELAIWASHQGFRTATSYCYPAEGSLPYAPVVSWLRAESLPSLEKIWLSEVARLLPEVLQKHPDLPASEPLREPWQRQRLFEALAHALLRKRHKTVLILEDVHWCDQDSLEWLHYLLRFDPKAPLLIVATVRSGEIVADHPLISLQTALRTEGKFIEIELSPLSEGEAITLIGQTVREVPGQNLSSEIVSQIVCEAEGNPLFAIERVRLGQTPHNDNRLKDGTPRESERVKTILTHRINQLSPLARETTSLAAVIGREFSLEVLRTASSETDLKLVIAIDEMLQKHIIREIAADIYDFTHDRLRGAAFGELSTAHQRLLHQMVAEAYLRLDEASPHPRNAEIANHYERAGLSLQAITHYRLAAEDAAHIFANAEAQRYFERAIELSKALGIGEPNGISPCDFAVLLERYGDLLTLNGKYPEAQSIFEQTLAQPAPCPNVWYSQVYRKISHTFLQQYQHPPAYLMLDRAEQALKFHPESASMEEQREWIKIQIARCQLYYWDNKLTQLNQLSQEIKPFIEADGSIDQEAELLSIQIIFKVRHERYRLSNDTVELARQGLEFAEVMDNPYRLAWAHFQLGFSLLWHGEPELAYQWFDKGYAGAARMGDRLLQTRCLSYLSIISRKRTDIEKLESQTDELLELASMIGEHIYQGVGLANRAWLAWRNGDDLKAKNDCQSAIEIWNQFHGGFVFHGLAEWILLTIALSHHDAKEAATSAQHLLNPTSQRLPDPLTQLLNDGLHAYQGKDEDSAFQLFHQAVEQAIASGEL